jgi:alanine racemase
MSSGGIHVNRAAIAANLALMRKLAPDANVAAVVKADAYGLGLAGVLPALRSCDSFFVACVEEGVTLRALVPQARIFVLNGADSESAPVLIAHRLNPVLGSLEQIARWQAAAQTERRPLEAALHVDTGMSRLGLPAEELSVLAAEAARRLDGITPVLAMSHLACADNANTAMNRTQLSRFRAALALLPAMPASLAASGGVLLGRDYHFDLVRPGIGLYGGNPQTGAANPMQPVARLAGRILQLRQIAPGDSIGYGAIFVAERPMTIATIALGYADGVLRSGSTNAFAMVKAHVAPFVGRVSMDLITLDVSGIAGVAVGDDAELFGPDLPLDEAAAAWGTISYELLTGLSRRIPRLYVDA